jgi:hypothetical protein
VLAFDGLMSSPGEELDLHCASRAGFEGRVRYLLEVERAECNAVDAFDATPLFYAVYGGHTGVISLLLENGARCDADTFVGAPPPTAGAPGAARDGPRRRTVLLRRAERRHPDHAQGAERRLLAARAAPVPAGVRGHRKGRAVPRH